MARPARALLVVALASGCLEAPPDSAPAGGDRDASPDGGPGSLTFPPSGADVSIEAAIAADVDSDGLEDLVLLDGDVSDDWAGLYILRAGPDGWTGIDEVRLDFRPSAVRFGRLLRAGGSTLAVGGQHGEVVLVDYTADADYEIVPLTFDPPPEAVALLHSGVVTAGDLRASLLLYDGTQLYRSTPIDEVNGMQLELLNAGNVLDAAFWPLDATEVSTYSASRMDDRLDWYTAEDAGGGLDVELTAARFAHLVSGLCGSFLAVGTDQSLSIGSISCDGMSSSLDPLLGDGLDEIVAMAAGDLAGTVKHDVALLGYLDGSLFGQVLIDINFAVDAYSPGQTTDLFPLDGLVPEKVFLTPADVEGTGEAAIYAVAPSGSIYCAAVVSDQIEICPGRWTVKAR